SRTAPKAAGPTLSGSSLVRLSGWAKVNQLRAAKPRRRLLGSDSAYSRKTSQGEVLQPRLFSNRRPQPLNRFLRAARFNGNALPRAPAHAGLYATFLGLPIPSCISCRSAATEGLRGGDGGSSPASPCRRQLPQLVVYQRQQSFRGRRLTPCSPS